MATLFNKMDFIGFIAADHFHTRANSLLIITDGIVVITFALLPPTISLSLHRRLMDKPHCSTCDINQVSGERKKYGKKREQRLGRGSSNSSKRSDSYPHPHLGGQLEEIEVPCSLKSPARSLKTIFLRLPAGFFVFRVL